MIEKLSKRETEILTLLAQGLSNEQMAEKLCVSVYTIKTHITNIYSKLDLTCERGHSAMRVRAAIIFFGWKLSSLKESLGFLKQIEAQAIDCFKREWGN